MSFENTILPEILMRDLYRNVFLIRADTGNRKDIEMISGPQTEALRFLGNNLKKIVIVVCHPSETYLPDKHLDFLLKILAACKLNIADIAILNEGYNFVNITTIRNELKPQHIILFGIDPTDLKLPLNFPHFKIQNYDEVAYLSVPPLDALNSDTEEGKLLKTKLWVCLKAMFEVTNGK